MASPVTARFPRALRLLPLLILYVLFVLFNAKDAFIGDEHRYLLGARNILQGFLASEETLFLWNGPGYPLYLAPFAALGLPLLLAKLGNALLLYLAMIRFHQALDLMVPRQGKAAPWGNLAATYGLGIFLLLHGTSMELLMTECLCAFFICSAAYHYLVAIRRSRPGLQPLWAGLHLAGLALTKVFFGYAVTAGLLAAGLWWLLSGLRAPRNAVLVCAYALAFCLPYLAYTHKLTGKVFFWSNSGGSQLYCMSLRESELLGDWLNFDAVLTFRDFFRGQAPFYEELSRMDYVSRDRAMKAAAIRNIKADPRKYFRNWRANVNRMVFGYPNSRYPGSDSELATGNRSFLYAFPFFLAVFTMPWAWSRRRLLPAGVLPCLAFCLLSLGGLSLLSAFPRMVFPLLPLLALWMAAVWLVREKEGGEAGPAGRQAIKST